MRQKQINLNIDSLVLKGFSQSDAEVLGRSLETGLHTLFSERGLPSSLNNGIALSSMNIGKVDVSPGSHPAATGDRLAHAIYGSFKK